MKHWATEYLKSKTAFASALGAGLLPYNAKIQAQREFLDQNPGAEIPKSESSDFAKQMLPGLIPLATTAAGAGLGYGAGHLLGYHDPIGEAALGGMGGMAAGLPLTYLASKKLESNRLNKTAAQRPEEQSHIIRNR